LIYIFFILIEIGCLTLLHTDQITGALQVRSKSGAWIDADPIPGAYVVNIGDMLNVKTNSIITFNVSSSLFLSF